MSETGEQRSAEKRRWAKEDTVLLGWAMMVRTTFRPSRLVRPSRALTKLPAGAWKREKAVEKVGALVKNVRASTTLPRYHPYKAAKRIGHVLPAIHALEGLHQGLGAETGMDALLADLRAENEGRPWVYWQWV